MIVHVYNISQFGAKDVKQFQSYILLGWDLYIGLAEWLTLVVDVSLLTGLLLLIHLDNPVGF